jgi:hypothetical protein
LITFFPRHSPPLPASPFFFPSSAETNSSQARIIGTKCLEVSAFPVQKWIQHELYPRLDTLEDDAGPTVVVRIFELMSQIWAKNSLLYYPVH